MNSPKIAIVGSGSVGSYYGALLARHFDVSFLMRRDLDAVQKSGLRIESVDGNFHLHPVNAFGSTEEIGAVDLVVIAIKATANEVLPDLLPPLLKKTTILLTLQNGLGNEDFLHSHFPEQTILGGLCIVCINRGEPGVIKHLAHGLVEMGSFQNNESLQEVFSLFSQAEIPCRMLPDLDLARWRKLIWNIPFNGLSVAAGSLDTRQILASEKQTKRTLTLMHEVIAIAAAHGHEIDSEFAEKNISRTREMGAYEPSSLIDYKAGNLVEVEAIWGEPLRRAKAKNVATPELEKLYQEICDAVASRSS